MLAAILRAPTYAGTCGSSFLIFLPTNSGRNNDPDKLFLDHGAGRECVGEPHETITHHRFNGGADDCCRSVAHNSRQRLGLGLARRMGMGRCRTGACSRSLNRWRDSRVFLRLRLRLRLWLSVLRLRLREWLLRRLQSCLSPRYPPPYLCPRCGFPASLVKRPEHHVVTT